MKKHTRDKWLGILNRFVASGMSFDEFAKSNQLNSGTLRQYYYLMRRELDGERVVPNPRHNRGSSLPNFDVPEDLSNDFVQYFLPRFIAALQNLQEDYAKRPAEFEEQLPSIAMFGKALMNLEQVNIPRLKYLLEPIVDGLEDGYLGHKDAHKSIQSVLELWRDVAPQLQRLQQGTQNQSE